MMADGPGRMGEAPPQSPAVIDIAVRFLVLTVPTSDRGLAPPEPATPLSAVKPVSWCPLSSNPNDLEIIVNNKIVIKTLTKWNLTLINYDLQTTIKIGRSDHVTWNSLSTASKAGGGVVGSQSQAKVYHNPCIARMNHWFGIKSGYCQKTQFSRT